MDKADEDIMFFFNGHGRWVHSLAVVSVHTGWHRRGMVLAEGNDI